MLRSLQRLHLKFQSVHNINDVAKRRKPRLLTKEIMNTIEQSLKSDDELTARKLKAKLAEEFLAYLTFHWSQLSATKKN